MCLQMAQTCVLRVVKPSQYLRQTTTARYFKGVWRYVLLQLTLLACAAIKATSNKDTKHQRHISSTKNTLKDQR